MIQFRFLGSKKALVQSLIIACWGGSSFRVSGSGVHAFGG